MVVGSSASNAALSGSILPATHETRLPLGLFRRVFKSRNNTKTYEVMVVVVTISLVLLCYVVHFQFCETAVGNFLWIHETLQTLPRYYVHGLTYVFNQQNLSYEKLVRMVQGKTWHPFEIPSIHTSLVVIIVQCLPVDDVRGAPAMTHARTHYYFEAGYLAPPQLRRSHRPDLLETCPMANAPRTPSTGGFLDEYYHQQRGNGRYFERVLRFPVHHSDELLIRQILLVENGG